MPVALNYLEGRHVPVRALTRRAADEIFKRVRVNTKCPHLLLRHPSVKKSYSRAGYVSDGVAV